MSKNIVFAPAWPLILIMMGFAAAAPAAQLVLDQPGRAYFAADVPYEFDPAVKDAAAGDKLAGTVFDYTGAAVKEVTGIVGQDGRCRFSLQLPQGYYTLKVPAVNDELGLVVYPDRAAKPDFYFAVDAGYSWFPWGAAEVSMMDALRRVKIVNVRERLSWREIADDKTVDQWAAGSPGQGRRYLGVRERHGANGIKVLDCFQDAPASVGADNAARNSSRFPSDQLAAYRQWLDYFPRFAPYLGGLEVWNEPDDNYGPVTAYVPTVKTIAYVNQKTKSHVPIVGGSYSQLTPDVFREGAMRSRMCEVVDAISYHNYSDLHFIEGSIRGYRDLLREYGRESLPIYLTECGWPWSGESAKNIIGKAVEGKACGLTQFYPFFAQNYREGTLDFSMIRANRSPLPVMGAYAYLAARLADFEYVGDLNINIPEISKARVLSDGKEYIAVIYSDATGATFRLPNLPVTRLEGIDGREIAKTDMVCNRDGVMYWHLTPAKIGGLLKTNTPAMKLLQRSKLPLAPAKVSPVVLAAAMDDRELSCGRAVRSGYRIKSDAEKNFTLTVDLFNLGDEAADLDLELEVPGKVTVKPDKKQSFTVPAGSKISSVWQLDAAGYFIGNYGFEAVLTARDKQGMVKDYIAVPLLKTETARKVYEVRRCGAKPTAADWDRAAAVTMARNGNFETDDFGVCAKFLWNDQGLLFLIKVKDIIHVQENLPQEAWRQDSVSFAFDAANSMRNDGTQYEYGISSRSGSPRWYCYTKGLKKTDVMSKESRFVFTRSEAAKMSTYTGMIAWDDITPFKGAPDASVGFDFCVTNGNGAAERESLEWTPGIESGSKDSSLFGLLKFVP